MDFSQLLHPDIQRYLHQHEDIDEVQFVLKYKSFLNVPSSLLAEQIKSRRKAKDKLPAFYKTENIIYPPQLNLEQSSSEITAQFKAGLVKGKELVDLTGGFGIDSYFFSLQVDHVSYVEIDLGLQKIVEHNFKTLDATNIDCHNLSAEDYLKKMSSVDIVYIDPSRRSKSTKVVKLADCFPNIIALQKDILKKSSRLLIKASPLLDIQAGLRELINVSDVFVVSVDNECKEVLFLSSQTETEPVIHTVNLLSQGSQYFDFTFANERASVPEFSSPKKYLYEPNTSILKGGAFRFLATTFNIEKINTNTHLYTSDNLITDFPGRIFEVHAIVKPDPISIAKVLPERKANIITRNYPLAPEELKKKLKINDGGEVYILAFSGQKEKFVTITKRVK